MVSAFDSTPTDLIAECQLRKFIGLAGSRDLQVAKVVTGVKGADASLAVCGTLIEVDQHKHAVLAVVVKENSNAMKLPDLFLHWATCKQEGSAWFPPPAGCTQYPAKLITDMPGCGAWRTPFAVHSSPDGKSLHVAMLHVPVDGVLRSGGLTFVLNSGKHWMHNPNSGRDWFIPISGRLPSTTDLKDLPDLEIFPWSLLPPPDMQEAADRKLLQARFVRTGELQQQQDAAAALAKAAQKIADAATVHWQQALVESDFAVAQLRASRAEEQQLKETLQLAENGASAAHATVKRCLQEQEIYAKAFADASAAVCEAIVCMDATEASADVDINPVPAEVKLSRVKEAEARIASFKADLTASRASLEAAESLVKATQVELVQAQEAVTAAVDARTVALVAVSVATKAKEEAVEAAQTEAAAAVAVYNHVQQELAELDRLCSEAAARVWINVERRQLLRLKRFLVEAGPKEPLNLKWLLPPSLSGRSLPVVATPFNGVRDIRSADDNASWTKLDPCTIEDLQSVMRSQMRKWLGMSPSQELHVIQYRSSTRLLSGEEIPVLAWVTEAREAPDSERSVEVVVVLGVDQSATGSRSGRLQLHWGATTREGVPPTQLAGPGWRTSSQYNWESGGCTLVTPCTAYSVLKLDIGLRRNRRAAAALTKSIGDYCAVIDGGAAEQQEERNSEKQAHLALLQLPLEGLFLHGGLSFTLKDASGHHLNNASTGKAFFLELGMMMQQLTYITQLRVLPAESMQVGEEPDEEKQESIDNGDAGVLDCDE